MPRRAIGQTLARASASDLRCFNLGAAYAPSGRNIMNAPADAAHLAAIVRGVESETVAEAYRLLGLSLSSYRDKPTVRAAAAPQPGHCR